MAHTVIKPISGNFSNADDSTILVGGDAQELFAADEGRVYFLFQNHSSAAQWLEFGATAIQGPHSIKVARGRGFIFEGSSCPISAISLIGPTTGQSFTAKISSIG